MNLNLKVFAYGCLIVGADLAAILWCAERRRWTAEVCVSVAAVVAFRLVSVAHRRARN